MQLKTFFSSYKKKIFMINNEPLTNISKIFLAIFVLFCFIMIIESLNQQKNIIETPYDRFSYKCIQLIKLKNTAIDIYNFKYSSSSISSDAGCKEIDNIYSSLYNLFKYRLETIKSVVNEKQILHNNIKNLKNEYSDMLLEKVANQPQKQSPLSENTNTIKHQINKYKNKLKILEARIHNLENIYQLDDYKKLIYSLKQHSSIYEDFNSYIKKYDLKVLASIYLFLIPLFLIVYFMYNFAIKKEKHIIAHILVNLLNVVAIFLLFYLLDFTYNIIPKVIFIKIYMLLESFNIIAFLNYIIIIFFIFIFWLIIKYIQKRALQQKRIKNTQLSDAYLKKGLCCQCGASKDGKNKYCPSCGEALYYECKSCKENRIVGSIFCQECGEA